jgi:hypothetical protein
LAVECHAHFHFVLWPVDGGVGHQGDKYHDEERNNEANLIFQSTPS